MALETICNFITCGMPLKKAIKEASKALDCKITFFDYKKELFLAAKSGGPFNEVLFHAFEEYPFEKWYRGKKGKHPLHYAACSPNLTEEQWRKIAGYIAFDLYKDKRGKTPSEYLLPRSLR